MEYTFHLGSCKYPHRLQVHTGQEFPGVPVVGIQFLLPKIKVQFPGWGTKILLATWCGQKKKVHLGPPTFISKPLVDSNWQRY